MQFWFLRPIKSKCMKDVNCFGIIPLKMTDGHWQVLLIKHIRGNYWAFPKGHGEPGEDSHQSASRELEEETGLSIKKYLSDEAILEHYNFVSRGVQIHKTVTYFIAEVEGELSLQKEEIMDAKWTLLSQVEAEITFPEGKKLCRRVLQLICE